MSNILFVPSNNGFGHLRRLTALLQEFITLGFKCALIWDKRIPLPKKILPNSLKFKLHQIETPLIFDGPFIIKEAFYDKKNLEKLVKKYDFVISDGVSWPAKISEGVVFTSHFIWEYYYLRKGEKTDLVHKSISDISKKNRVFSMKNFIWQEMYNLGRVIELPIFDYWNLREFSHSHNNEIVSISSGILSEKNLSNSIQVSLKDLEILKTDGIEKYVFSKKECPIAVLCRSGMGALSESLSMKSIPIFLPDNDLEIKMNMKACLEMDIGIELNDFILNSKDDPKFLHKKREQIHWPEVLSMKELATRIVGE